VLRVQFIRRPLQKSVGSTLTLVGRVLALLRERHDELRGGLLCVRIVHTIIVQNAGIISKPSIGFCGLEKRCHTWLVVNLSVGVC